MSSQHAFDALTARCAHPRNLSKDQQQITQGRLLHPGVEKFPLVEPGLQ